MVPTNIVLMVETKTSCEVFHYNNVLMWVMPGCIYTGGVNEIEILHFGRLHTFKADEVVLVAFVREDYVKPMKPITQHYEVTNAEQ